MFQAKKRALTIGATASAIFIGALLGAPAASAAPPASPVSAASVSTNSWFGPDFTRTAYGSSLKKCNDSATFIYNSMMTNPVNKLVIKGKCTIANGPGNYRYKAVIAAWT